jgi:hypothetical protein
MKRCPTSGVLAPPAVAMIDRHGRGGAPAVFQGAGSSACGLLVFAIMAVPLGLSLNRNLVRAVVITPRGRMQKTAVLQKAVEDALGRPVRLDLDQVLLEPGAGALDAQREELRQAGDQLGLEAQRMTVLSRMIGLMVRGDRVPQGASGDRLRGRYGHA